MYKAYYIERDYTKVTGKTAEEDLEAYKAFLTLLENTSIVPFPVFTPSGRPYIWIIGNTDTDSIEYSWHYYEEDYDEAEEAYENTLDDDLGGEDIEEIVLEDNVIRTLTTKRDSFIGGL